jgi:spermidine/putrescine transport system substrate-binding protein
MATQSPQTRAEFLKRSSVFAALLAGGGSVAAGRAVSAWGASAATQLTFVGWQGYDGTPEATFPDLVAWQNQAGISVNATYIDNNPQIITKIQASPAGTYDLCTPIHTIVPSMTAAGLLEPLAVNKLKNWSSLQKVVRDLKYLHSTSGTVYAVPLGFGYTTFPMYNPKLLKRPPTSWNELLTRQFKGKYAVNDLPENLTWIARTLGYGHPDPHHITRAELKKCQTYARRLVKNAKTVSASYGDLLQLFATNEIALSVDGTPDIIDKAQTQGVTLRKWFPKEGGAGAYMDNFAIPKGAKNYDAAVSWIDEMISPTVNAEIAVVYGGAPTNRASVSSLPSSLQKRYPFAKIATFFQQTPVYPPQPTASRIFATYSDWVEAWTAAKQG